jgi:hypothetical protein
LVLAQETGGQRHAQAHRIDIPSGDLHFPQPIHAATAQRVNAVSEIA